MSSCRGCSLAGPGTRAAGRRHASARALLLVAFLAGAAPADEPVELDEAELDRVTAGTQETADRLLSFDFSRTTRSGRTVSGDGWLDVLGDLTALHRDVLFLGDGAQGNLSSLVNINAVNSQINVLLNLTINVDSTVGTLSQLNFNAATPPGPPPKH